MTEDIENTTTTGAMQQMRKNSYLSGGNAAYLEELYEAYLKDPNSVAPEWQDYFRSLPQVNSTAEDISHFEIQDYFVQLAKQPKIVAEVSSGDALLEKKQANVDRLIQAYRTFGHLAAKIDPLGMERPRAPELDFTTYGLSKADFSETFYTQDLLGSSRFPLSEIYARLNNVYCQTIGFEYAYVSDQEELRWLQQRIEQGNRAQVSPEEKREILKLLMAADGLEKYLGNKYVGQKRFSLEGGDSLIPMLHQMVQSAGNHDVEETIIGMAHRGRLNVLINIMGKSAAELFQEFEGTKDYGLTTGDVKYHLGFSSNVPTAKKPMHLSLAFNPSHLEIISAVVMGAVRAKQHRRGKKQFNSVMPILIHGDAAVAGQGIVMETLNMSRTRAYDVGGSVHIVVNNQVGFTTSNPQDARSSRYCTDIAKMIEAPVFHVNGDDPEAVVFIAKLAVEYRTKFKKDIVIDLVCYREHGHNEADEPAATQPLMYKNIKRRAAPAVIYAQQLVQEDVCTQADVDKIAQEYRAKLDAGRQVVTTVPDAEVRKYMANWTPFIGQAWTVVVDTGVDRKHLMALANQLQKLPEGFQLQRQVGHVMEARAKMAKGELPLDWGYAETLAYATLLDAGYPIRLTGQDSRRGTFAHRHAALHDQNNGHVYMPLRHLNAQQADIEIYDSVLSEAGVVGFEYGYAESTPNGLTMWEAQFGDFANGAQVVIDQFISSGWQKWQRLCGLVLLLPHGQEGMGPEHSSARLERFMQLCAQENIQVCVPSTPAQVFHMLRRQILRPFRAPLVVMTPKSLLRHKLAVSSLDELATGKFQLVIPEIDDIKVNDVQRVVLCSGKVYYDLLMKRRENNLKNVALIRIEQLYPFPYDEVKAELKRYKKTKDIIWCQEEPKNQGAWYASRHNLEDSLQEGQVLHYAGREAFAAPAVGYPALHAKQQAALVAQALGIKG